MAHGTVPHSWCRECYRAYFRAGHHKRKPANNKRSTEWQKNNREKSLASSQRWKEANGDKLQAYYKANLDKAVIHARTRRARLLGAEGKHTAADVADLLKKQRARCVYCTKSLKGGYHVDHILPLSRGGSNSKSNLQLTCARCNQTKSARDPIAHAQSMGRLL